MSANIQHLAIIMDGNARWARANLKPFSSGHRAGAIIAEKIINKISDLKVPYLTLYAFSSENWQRPAAEITAIMNILNKYLLDKIDQFSDKNIKLKVIGRLDKLPKETHNAIIEAIGKTKDNTGMTLVIALSYGARDEIVDACRKIVQQNETEIDINTIKSNLYDPDMPDVDLLIRTGAQQRLSNFLLWQSAYAELIFFDKYWPDFSEHDIDIAFKEFSKRRRRFGGRK